jgi:ATP-dependent DNA helicase RecG
MILELLGKFGSASRQEIDRLLAGKLSDALNDEQKLNKISNLLSNLRRAKRIRNVGSRKAPVWVLAE